MAATAAKEAAAGSVAAAGRQEGPGATAWGVAVEEAVVGWEAAETAEKTAAAGLKAAGGPVDLAAAAAAAVVGPQGKELLVADGSVVHHSGSSRATLVVTT